MQKWAKTHLNGLLTREDTYVREAQDQLNCEHIRIANKTTKVFYHVLYKAKVQKSWNAPSC